MSNSLAIATVTGALEARLLGLLNREELSGFGVFPDHPGSDPSPGIYLRLFRLAPNLALRNSDLPTRRSDGTLAARPRLALNLHYMLSFVGDRATYDAERLAGLVMTDLHAQPHISAEAIADYLGGLAAGHVLVRSDLAEQLEPVKLTPENLSVEDLARVWGLYNQSFFSLSMAYEASLVLLEPALRPTTALPVSATGLHVVPLTVPRLARLRPPPPAVDQPVVRVGDTLQLDGQSLRGPTTWLRLAGRLVRLPEAQVGQESIRVPLAPLDLRAGVLPVQVVHRLEVAPGSAEPFRTTAESNVLPLALIPTVSLASPDATPVTGGHELQLTVSPLPSSDQDVELVLDRLSGGPGRESARSWRRVGDTIVFTTATLAPGAWLVRLRVDGAMSLPAMNPAGVYASPAVNVP